jgi:hypothetical protein
MWWMKIGDPTLARGHWDWRPGTAFVGTERSPKMVIGLAGGVGATGEHQPNGCGDYGGSSVACAHW